MVKSEFSETQFVIAYTRELFNHILSPFTIYSPSTRTEKQDASDIVLRHYGSRGHYRYSEFYQFKRSKYFDSESFDSLRGGITVDTSATPMHGFDIYNSSKTKQFNVLQKIANKPRCHAYYCAPLFHTVKDFNDYFKIKTILANSKLIPLSQSQLQSVRIPLGSNHKIIFDRANQYLCSDPIEIQGYLASERELNFSTELNFDGNYFRDTIKDIHQVLTAEIRESELDGNFEPPPVNFFEVREMLLTYFNIYWFPNDFFYL